MDDRRHTASCRDTVLVDLDAAGHFGDGDYLELADVVALRSLRCCTRGATGENDSMAARSVDGDELSAWRTETYDQPDFFGDKTGVGLVVELEQRSRVDSLRISGSTNGWSGQVFVMDEPPGPDGLDDIRRIIADAPARIRSGGWLVLEIGADQGDAVAGLFVASGFQDVAVQPDLAGHDRIALGRRP